VNTYCTDTKAKRTTTVRKLASIRKITEIRPIVNADAIEVAVVDGWSVVTRKGEYTVGD